MSDEKIVRVRDVMKSRFDVVDGLTSVQDALNRMKHVETKCLLVNKRHENDEYGIVLIADIARQVLAKDRAPERVNIYEIMSKPVLTVDPDMDIRYCARLFDKFGLSRAPVVENKELVGIVSYTDMVLSGMMNSS
ncbi:MAG: CBS domain-containing protein [Acidiferrobacterales bacterium]